MPAGSLMDDLALRLARGVLGLTQRDAADRFNVTENTYRRWELDGMRPDPARRDSLRRFIQEAIARTEGRVLPVESNAVPAVAASA